MQTTHKTLIWLKFIPRYSLWLKQCLSDGHIVYALNVRIIKDTIYYY